MKNIYFLDLETTGLNTDTDRIIEIAIVNSENPEDYFQSYVNPGIAIAQSITDVTGITNEMLSDKPKLSEIAPKILEKLQNAECIGGHNVLRYDLPLLVNDLHRNGAELILPPDFKVIDTLQVERLLVPHNLGATYKRYYGKDFEGWHGALADTKASIAIATAQQQSIANQSIEQSMTTTIGVDICGKVALNADGLLIWTFGKYNGQPVANDLGYAMWVLKNDFPESTKRAVLNAIRKQ